MRDLRWGLKDNNRNFGMTRTPFDINKVKCYKCAKMGHYARNCPGTPDREVTVEKVEPNLN